jgi:quinol-cytochrome oxidoreductase complex cytochrome b subunit
MIRALNTEENLPSTSVKPLLPIPGGLLNAGYAPFRKFAAFTQKALPASFNPIQAAGALANFTFVIALITGVLLLLWYKPSVHEAYSSIKAMEGMPWLAGLMRSLHRYASDACLLFVVLHGLENFFAKRFERPRWMAWVTGIVLMAMLWLDGWLGYWLVWDDVAQRVAMQSARFVDLFPLFQDPLARSFLTRETLNSLFFFVVFFIHMLIPMTFALGLWLHISRLNQSRFFPSRRVGIATLAALTVFALAWPARASGPADLGRITAEFKSDFLYLLPLDRKSVV